MLRAGLAASVSGQISIMSTTSGPSSSITMQAQWRKWLIGRALPLWSDAGFDSSCHLYHERLGWDASPVPMKQLRLMVQARQVATYCRAAIDGFYDRSAQAVRCLDEIERLYRHCDGAPGWIFSLASDGRPASRVRDLYAHAFILFAYAWAYKLTAETRYRTIARETMDEIHTIFAAGNGGFRDSLPPADSLRRQNPHMHMLEACLTLSETTGDAFYLNQARPLVSLALERFIDARSGMVREFFDAEWVAALPPGRNRAEPGHLFEWSWLLHEYSRLSGCTGAESMRIAAAADRLFASGVTAGCHPGTGLAFDAVTEDGIVIEHSTRIWPQTELMRLLGRKQAHDGVEATSMLPQISGLFFERYAPDHLAGGWIDRLDQQLRPMVDHMPASSLYHIYGAGREMMTRAPEARQWNASPQSRQANVETFISTP